jgi:hypothetical protein
MISRTKNYFTQLYRINLPIISHEKLVWKDLKKMLIEANWRHGVFENDKYAEVYFEISDGELSTYYYMIYDGYFHCRVKILEHFDSELTTDLFVLATHFNNLLNNGVVLVHVKNNYIEYHQKRDLLVPYLYRSEIYGQLIRHYKTSKDIFQAFRRLEREREAPAIIIADLLNKLNQDKETES